MTKKIKYLKDYRSFDYAISTVELIFNIDHQDQVWVNNKTHYQSLSPHHNTIILNGSAQLLSVKVNGVIINDYHLESELLTINNLPAQFELEISSLINPEQNKTCMGLYASNNSLYTQCEPEGFRKITYYPDRPDVLAIFQVTIIADPKKYIHLLSNGHKLSEKILTNGYIEVKWLDPYKKPSYLFALFAGNLAVLEDTFKTKSDKIINLQIYTKASDQIRSHHAMTSLKRAMNWDQTRFDLEYDLNRYMIVATSDFNMGAMENKGLNIFNSKYVLADQRSATDTDFINVEAVIGHEYFHNWTGNRVTCRDWFQLSLKEGLTVFRDQEFTADLHNPVVKRIQDVKTLRQLQFSEDSSSLAHPVRPDSYLEINNFYTMTVYEKGAEVVRMYQTMLSKAGFNRGLALYLNRFDGMAATCDDFYQAMQDSNPQFNLAGFKLWYSQAGTPVVNCNSYYDSLNKIFTVEFNQQIADTPAQHNKSAMLIPIAIGLVDRLGHEVENYIITHGRYVQAEHTILILDRPYNKFVFEQVKTEVVPSLLRQFSAPIKLNYNYQLEERILLINHDRDYFMRFENLQNIYTHEIKNCYQALINQQNYSPPQSFFTMLDSILLNPNLESDFKALMFNLPTFREILANGLLHVQPQQLQQAIFNIGQMIGVQLFPSFLEIYNLNMTKPYQFNDHPQRSLKNCALYYICLSMIDQLDKPHSKELLETLIWGQYNNSDNMTDHLGVLIALNHVPCELRTLVLAKFYQQFESQELIMDKWFMVQADSMLINCTILQELMNNPKFIITNPNKVYALLRTFSINAYAFNNAQGYDFIAQQIINIDQFNPQVASTLAKSYAHLQQLTLVKQNEAKIALNKIIMTQGLSSNVYEIVNKIIS